MITSPEQITQSDSQPGTTIQSPESRVNVYLKGGNVPTGNNVIAIWENGDDGLKIEVISFGMENYLQPGVVEAVRRYFDEDTEKLELEIDPKVIMYAMGCGGLRLLRTVGGIEEEQRLKEQKYIEKINALLGIECSVQDTPSL